MSKSKGEFLTVSLLEEKGYDPLVYRFFCLQSHYRKGLVFSWEKMCIRDSLSAMRRRTTKAELIALFDKLRAAMPDVVIRTSLICGLPGETDEAFEELCELSLIHIYHAARYRRV